MKVELVRYTINPHEAIELAASNCYDSIPNGKIMNACYKSGHHSVLEFAQFHFHIEGVSRALTHQLVRHRTGSFAQRSQRYVSSYGEGIPPLPKGDSKTHGGQRFYDNQEKFIADMYNRGFSTRELSEMYGGDPASIYHFIQKYTNTRGLSECKGIDKDYFKEIDSPVKAYILGFLYSDGCLSIKKNGLKQIILDQLAEEELLLTNILHEIKPNGDVIKSGHDNIIRVAIQDNDLCTDLERYGMVERKGTIAKFDNILKLVPDRYIRDVIRGVFEGDGHIGLMYNTNGEINDAKFNIAGTYDTCKSIQLYLINKFGLSETKIQHNVNKSYKMEYGGKSQVTKIIDWLYKDIDMNFIHAIKAKTVFELIPGIKRSYISQISDVVNNKYEAVIPPSVLNNISATNSYILTLTHIKKAYKELQYHLATTGRYGEQGNEDARYLLPNACCTTIDVSFDFRNLIHFMNERLCTRAQWEIRELAQKMRDCVIEVFPEAKDMLVPKCERYDTAFCPETKSCGRHKTIKELINND